MRKLTKFLILLFLAVTFFLGVGAGDKTFRELSPDTSPTADDLLITLDDPSGTPQNKKVTVNDLRNALYGVKSIDSSLPDQGIYTTGSVKYYVDEIGVSKSDTLLLAHDGPGNTTTYTFSTSVTIPSNIRVVREEGAILHFNDGAILTQNGPFESPISKAFTWTGTGKITFGSGVIREYPIEWRGAVGDDSTDCTTAIQKTLTEAQTAGVPVTFGKGTYLAAGLTNFNYQMILRGAGPEDTNLKSFDGTTVIEITGKSLHTLAIENMSITGTGTGTGHGIYIHDNDFSPYKLSFKNLDIRDHGGKGIYIPEEFSSYLEGIFITGCGDNALEIQGGNTTVLKNIFVGAVAEDKCAYRIYGGNPTLIACNGITSGTNADWGVFGRTVVEDGVASYAYPTLISCNIEDFTNRGIRFKTGSYANYFSTSILAPATGTVTALSYQDCPGGIRQGIWDGMSDIDTKGAAWDNGKPVHSVGVPFLQLGHQEIVDFYNDGDTNTYNLPYLGIEYLYAQNYGFFFSSGRAEEFVYRDRVISKAANYECTETNYMIAASGAGTTITLPENAPSGTRYVIKRKDVANAIVVSRKTADVIDGAVSWSLDTNNAVIAVESDGANYHILWTYGTVT